MSHYEVDLVDIEVANALQVSPRVTWSVVGSALGLSEATVSRRWRDLSSRGMSWTSSALHASSSIGAFVEIRSKKAVQSEIVHALSRHPDVITVGQTTGDTNIFCITIATTLEGVLATLNDGLPELASAEYVRSSLFAQIAGGIEWSQGVISPATERRILKTGMPVDDAPTIKLTRGDREIFLALAHDGRKSLSSLESTLQRSAAGIRKRIEELIKSRALVFRADVARPLFDQPISLLLSLKVDPSEANHVAQRLGVWRETRFCAAVSGSANLILIVGVHDLVNAERILTQIVAEFPTIEVKDQKICTRFSKIYGRLLDSHGRGIDVIPVDPWYRTADF